MSFKSPDFEMVNRVLFRLNEQFDPDELFKCNIENETEMFVFHYSTDNEIREKWEIRFLGSVVAIGGEYGLDYSEKMDDNYLSLERENEEIIFNIAYERTMHIIEFFMKLIGHSDISEFTKQKWIKLLKSKR